MNCLSGAISKLESCLESNYPTRHASLVFLQSSGYAGQMKRSPKGLIPPVPTPFTKSGELDVSALQALVKGLEPQVDGFLILGSNGEAVFLSEEERRTVLEAAREVIPRDKPMIAGTGGETTRLVAKRNEVAAEIGADYALVFSAALL